MARYYFLASSLPPMPVAIGEKLAKPFSEIGKFILRNIEPEDEPLVRCSLLAIDTANAEYFLKGQDVFLEGGIMTQEELEGKRHLPPFMKKVFDERDQGNRRGYGYDILWEGYYAYAYSLAEEMNCRFLIDYLSWEISLRNSLVELRAKAMGKDAEDYQVLSRVRAHDFSGIISNIKAQKNPLKTEMFLDEERLKRIHYCEGTDPFSRDAILGALEKTRVYSRWERLNSTYPIHDTI